MGEQVTLTLYNATLFHGGNLLHGVPLNSVTERELRLLRDIHGKENIDNVERVGSIETDSTENYFQLVDKYGSREDYGKAQQIRKRVERLFNLSLDDFDEWLANITDEAEAKKRARMQEADRQQEADMQAEVDRRVEVELRKRRIGAPPKQSEAQEA